MTDHDGTAKTRQDRILATGRQLHGEQTATAEQLTICER